MRTIKYEEIETLAEVRASLISSNAVYNRAIVTRTIQQCSLDEIKNPTPRLFSDIQDR